MRRAPQPHERLLDEVLREAAVVQEVQAEGVQTSSVQVVEGRNGFVAVAGSQAGDERRFVLGGCCRPCLGVG